MICVTKLGSVRKASCLEAGYTPAVGMTRAGHYLDGRTSTGTDHRRVMYSPGSRAFHSPFASRRSALMAAKISGEEGLRNPPSPDLSLHRLPVRHVASRDLHDPGDQDFGLCEELISLRVLDDV
jgi:hypothetical protein